MTIGTRMIDRFWLLDDDMLVEVLKHLAALDLLSAPIVCGRWKLVECEAQDALWKRLVAKIDATACDPGHAFSQLGLTMKPALAHIDTTLSALY